MDRNLRIRVLLEAGDKLTRPLREVAAGSSRAAKALAATRDRPKEIDKAQADVAGFRKLKVGLRSTEAELNTAKARVAELAHQMAAAASPIKKLTNEFAKGSFIVDSIEHSGPPDALTIRARAADFTGGLTARREQSWHDTTIGAVVGDVAKRQGLTARCAPALAGIEVSITQSRESDMALLRRLGRENDAVATVKHGTLIFSPLGSATTATGKPIATVTIRRQDGDRHTFSIEKRDEATGVTASWHDVGEAKKKKVEVGSDGRRRHLSRVYASEDAARRAASAEQTRLAREPVKLRFDLALGRPEIIPATRVTATGFKPAIYAVAWLVSGATHNLTPEGLTTALEMEAASPE